MKNLLTTCLFSFALFLSVKAQQTSEDPVELYNGFQNTSSVDSAYYFVSKLAANPKYEAFLTELLHNTFVQRMLPQQETEAKEIAKAKQRYAFGKDLLVKMANDTSTPLRAAVYPMMCMVKLQESQGKAGQQAAVVKEFLTAERKQTDIHRNRYGRYALMIHQTVKDVPELKEISNELFAVTVDKLKAGQIPLDVNISDRGTLDKRAWYRWLYAYCNVQIAQAKEHGNDKLAAGEFYKLAFDYSPDLIDNNHYAAFYYDMRFLTGEDKKSFKEDYLKYVVANSGNKAKALAILLDITLGDPTHKKQLAAYYTNIYPKKKDFANYWTTASGANLKDAPDFKIDMMDGDTVGLEKIKNKWTLIDFWGTWCGPCRAEHPDLQKFYQSLSAPQLNRFNIVTIACRDSKAAVKAYMAKNKYTFPVAISSGQVEKNFPVTGYPFKVLINPQGKYLVVPYGLDWVNFVKAYSEI